MSFKIDDDLVAAVDNAGGCNTRAVKVDIDTKQETFFLGAEIDAGSTMDEDWCKMADAMEQEIPCYFLLRLKPSEGDSEAPPAEDNAWALVSWQPDDAPVKTRMVASSSQKTIKESERFRSLNWTKNYNITDKEEATFKAWNEATRCLSGDERRAAMTKQEQDAEDARLASEEERARAMANPMKLAGLGSVTVTLSDTVTSNIAALKEGGKALLGHVTGDRKKVIEGELLDGISVPSDLKGKLPPEEPCYVFLFVEDKVCMVSWLPDLAPVKSRMGMSTFKNSVVMQMKESCGQETMLTQEVSQDDWLTDDIGQKVEEEAGGAAAPAVKVPGMPVGGVKMPGMPPGGFKLPGM